jgi:hypothetical protein
MRRIVLGFVAAAIVAGLVTAMAAFPEAQTTNMPSWAREGACFSVAKTVSGGAAGVQLAIVAVDGTWVRVKGDFPLHWVNVAQLPAVDVWPSANCKK